MRKETCLQQSTGSCLGCDVLKIAGQKLRKARIPVAAVASELQESHCPPGMKMQTRHLRIRQDIGSMGQNKR